MTTDISRIHVIDDIIPDWLLNSFEKRIKKSERWRYGIGATELEYQRFFAIWIKKPGEYPQFESRDVDNIATYVNDAFNSILDSLVPNAIVKDIHRCHFNGQIPTTYELSKHLDWKIPDMWTLLFYVTGDDGDTVFYEEPEVDPDTGIMDPGEEVYRVKFKKGRMVFFPSYYWHAGEHPTQGFRVSLAFNYLLNNCEENQKIRMERGLPVAGSLNEHPKEIVDYVSKVENYIKDYKNQH
jgi:hypothetical protein